MFLMLVAGCLIHPFPWSPSPHFERLSPANKLLAFATLAYSDHHSFN
jgi:hypothetical protein